MKGLWNWFWSDNGFGPDGLANGVGKCIFVLVLVACVGGLSLAVFLAARDTIEREYQRRMCREGFGRYIVDKNGSPEFTTIGAKP